MFCIYVEDVGTLHKLFSLNCDYTNKDEGYDDTLVAFYNYIDTVFECDPALKIDRLYNSYMWGLKFLTEEELDEPEYEDCDILFYDAETKLYVCE